MSDWPALLAERGAQVQNGAAMSFGENVSDYGAILEQGAMFYLNEYALLSFRGIDSKKFLQGQITADVGSLNPHTLLPGAICTVKGRMLANFNLVELADASLLMQLHRDVVEATLAHLRKFAVFFKTEIADVSEAFVCVGLAGDNAVTGLRQIFGSGVPETAGQSAELSGISVFCVCSATYICIFPEPVADSYWQQLSSHCQPAGLPCWHLWNIRQGIGQVVGVTREEFIPQMLNLQATGGISFRKGCYTGQEIVARMRYLGKLKRRMYRLQIEGDQTTALAPGQASNLPGSTQNAGTVVMAAPVAESCYEILAVLTEEAAGATDIEIDNRPYKASILPLPYESELQSL